jgi:hypothetical protein
MNTLSVVLLTIATLWTLYMSVETYVFQRPQGRPYWVGFFITNFVLFWISIPLSVTSGVLRDRIRMILRGVQKEKEEYERAGKRKLIG